MFICALGHGSFCMNNCISAAWYGGDQPVALLRCYGNPGCFDNRLQLVCIVGSSVSHLPPGYTLRILCEVQVRQIGWPVTHSNTMVSKPVTSPAGKGNNHLYTVWRCWFSCRTWHLSTVLKLQVTGLLTMLLLCLIGQPTCLIWTSQRVSEILSRKRWETTDTFYSHFFKCTYKW